MRKSTRQYTRRDTGDVVGRAGVATIEEILDALKDEIQTKPWRKITPFSVVRVADKSAAVFYQYFGSIEEAAADLYARRLRQVAAGTAQWAAIVDPLPAF